MTKKPLILTRQFYNLNVEDSVITVTPSNDPNKVLASARISGDRITFGFEPARLNSVCADGFRLDKKNENDPIALDIQMRPIVITTDAKSLPDKILSLFKDRKITPTAAGALLDLSAQTLDHVHEKKCSVTFSPKTTAEIDTAFNRTLIDRLDRAATKLSQPGLAVTKDLETMVKLAEKELFPNGRGRQP